MYCVKYNIDSMHTNSNCIQSMYRLCNVISCIRLCKMTKCNYATRRCYIYWNLIGAIGEMRNVYVQYCLEDNPSINDLLLNLFANESWYSAEEHYIRWLIPDAILWYNISCVWKLLCATFTFCELRECVKYILKILDIIQSEEV